MSHTPSTLNYSLTIGWLYPDLMSIYGDRGNIIVLQKRCAWRGINVTIKEIGIGSSEKDLASCDLLVMGGAQDIQQEIVAVDLQKKKEVLQMMIEDGVTGLYICGGFQYLGRYYQTADGTRLPQLGVLDMYTENPGRERLIGNIAVALDRSLFNHRDDAGAKVNTIIVGFENHGGRTILGKGIQPLGKVVKGYGSNDSAKQEGAVYKHTIGTYLHGPILPKNPEIADWLITKALEKKYAEKITLSLLDDTLAYTAREYMLRKMGLHPRLR